MDMKDFAYPGHAHLVYFDQGDIVRWHEEGGCGPHLKATVVQTMKTRVLIKLENGKTRSVPNQHLSHDPAAYARTK